MTFTDAVSRCFSQYATFSGRARRSEYWYFSLFNFLISLAVFVIDNLLNTPIPGLLVSLAFIVPGLAVTWRRLHDTGRSGGWFFIVLVPIIGSIALIVFLLGDSQPGPGNRYGVNPKDDLPYYQTEQPYLS